MESYFDFRRREEECRKEDFDVIGEILISEDLSVSIDSYIEKSDSVITNLSRLIFGEKIISLYKFKGIRMTFDMNVDGENKSIKDFIDSFNGENNIYHKTKVNNSFIKRIQFLTGYKLKMFITYGHLLMIVVNK